MFGSFSSQTHKNQNQSTQPPKPSKILQESEKSFTFTVDSVNEAKTLPMLVSAGDLLGRLVGSNAKFEDFSHRGNNSETFVTGKVPGFIVALHTAYENHHHLKLSVSDFIILIGQGLGRHMDKNSEKLRKLFVDHEGKQDMVIYRNEFVLGTQNDWSTVFGEFADQIKARIKTDFYDIIIDDTSVATRDSRICSEITLMDCMKGYFNYVVRTFCGIPQITLEGSTADWENLLKKVRRLQEMNKDNCLLLDFWLKHLVPIVEKICETAISRKPDSNFWSGIYKYSNPGSGTPYISGWSTIFFPYLKDGVNSFQNPARITTDQIPKQVSTTPFIWDYFGQPIKMKLYAGFLGGKFDKERNTIEPAYFWAVVQDTNQKMEVEEDEEF